MMERYGNVYTGENPSAHAESAEPGGGAGRAPNVSQMLDEWQLVGSPELPPRSRLLQRRGRSALIPIKLGVLGDTLSAACSQDSMECDGATETTVEHQDAETCDTSAGSESWRFAFSQESTMGEWPAPLLQAGRHWGADDAPDGGRPGHDGVAPDAAATAEMGCLGRRRKSLGSELTLEAMERAEGLQQGGSADAKRQCSAGLHAAAPVGAVPPTWLVGATALTPLRHEGGPPR